MKKSISLSLLAVTLVAASALLAGCGTTPPSEPAPDVVSMPTAPPPPPPPPLAVPPTEPAMETGRADEVIGLNIGLSYSPRFFSPDGDGVEDYLTIYLHVTSETEIGGWHVEIREPQAPFLLFYEWSGTGMPPETLVWDGKSKTGELVQSVTAYNIGISISNVFEVATYQGRFETDVLVRREGDIMRIIIPSIYFAANRGDFAGLEADKLASNRAILARLADILNNHDHDTYRITVEGHANPVTAPGTRLRAVEEEEGLYAGDVGLKPLSNARATTIVRSLVELGVAQERLSAIGVGGTRPVVEYTDRNNWWKNRRVEFILHK